MAGALRVVSNLLEGGLVGHFEDDPAAPVFRQIVTSTRKSLGDNADAIYFDASVSPEYTYRARPHGRCCLRVVHGRGGWTRGGFPERTAGVLNDSDFDIDSEDASMSCSAGHRAIATGWRCPRRRRITTRHYWEQEIARDPGRVPMSSTSKCSTAPVHCPARRRHDRGRVPARCHLCAHADPRPEAPGGYDQPALASREPNKFPSR